MSEKTDKKDEKQTAREGTTVTYLDPGKGLVTRRCYDCDGTGRVYEGGYGLTDCPSCS
jgi:hypothetical protein